MDTDSHGQEKDLALAILVKKAEAVSVSICVHPWIIFFLPCRILESAPR